MFRCATSLVLDAPLVRIGKTYGCSGGKGMYTTDGCAAVFSVSGNVTACGSATKATNKVVCREGELVQAQDPCGLMILTSFFTTKKDWQRGKKTKASFKKVSKLYKTVLKHGLSVTVVYDELPPELIERYSCSQFQFHKVEMSEHDRRYGVNDVRYFFFKRLVESKPEWQYVFIVDAFDVRIGMSPCSGLKQDTLYIGIEQDRLKSHPWMKARFSKMGGKYDQWYRTKIQAKTKILNCGITGGSRPMMMKLLRRMTEVLQDPALAIRKKQEDINLNMAALNYIIYNEFEGSFSSGAPVHSVYKRFEAKRTDVWFIHK